MHFKCSPKLLTAHQRGTGKEGPRKVRGARGQETPGGVYTRGRQSGRTSESEGKQRSGMTLAGRIMTVKVKAMWAPPVKGEKGRVRGERGVGGGAATKRVEVLLLTQVARNLIDFSTNFQRPRTLVVLHA